LPCADGEQRSPAPEAVAAPIGNPAGPHCACADGELRPALTPEPLEGESEIRDEGERPSSPSLTAGQSAERREGKRREYRDRGKFSFMTDDG